jgi:hypothetical protein
MLVFLAMESAGKTPRQHTPGYNTACRPMMLPAQFEGTVIFPLHT